MHERAVSEVRRAWRAIAFVFVHGLWKAFGRKFGDARLFSCLAEKAG